tara:strand:+ start:2669 stop:3385 length:717 start_codon:yes stop_codon:yes gene_type:complete
LQFGAGLILNGVSLKWIELPGMNDFETWVFVVVAFGAAALVYGLKALRRRKEREKWNQIPHEPAFSPSVPPTPRVVRAPLPDPKPYDPNDSVESAPIDAVRTGAAYVVDGDTIVVKKTQIRLFGVDAPEMNHPFGKKAKWALVRLCKGQKVRAELISQDAHGRTVARCYLPDGRDLSAEMVKLGLAIDWPKYSGGIYAALETSDARKKMWLADARQKGRMHVWEAFDTRQGNKGANRS